MSIAAIPENRLDFQDGNNIRIAIAGLALCKFAPKTSRIRFLRHVPKHQLKLKIIQIRASDMALIGTKEYTIGDAVQRITIEGAEAPTPPENFIYKPTNYQERELKEMMDLSFLHGHKLRDKTTDLPDKLPTELIINNCIFYTAKLTDKEFDLEKDNLPIKLGRRFGEILGGYMKVAANNKLKITIPDFFDPPPELPVKNAAGTEEYLYEIQFNNSCFEENGQACKRTSNTGPTDFLKIYDILEDNVRPFETFDIRPKDVERTDVQPKQEYSPFEQLDLDRRAVDTGACLPVVEEPCLNCS
jgi:hypothetical protein